MELLRSLGLGLEEIIGEGGRTLSSGEYQILALIRGLIALLSPKLPRAVAAANLTFQFSSSKASIKGFNAILLPILPSAEAAAILSV